MSKETGNVGFWIAYWSKVDPKKEAVVFGERRVCYQELNENINKLAHALRNDFNVKKGDRVCCLLENCVEYYEIVLACSKIGARFVPVNIRLKGQEILYIVGNSKPKILITENRFLSTLENVNDPALTGISLTIEGDSFKKAKNNGKVNEPEDQACWEDDFGIVYTSGTTGYPKGAVITHNNIKFLCDNAVVGLSYNTEDKYLIQFPLCFTGGLLPCSMPMFYTGGTIILEKQFEPSQTMELVEREKVTIWSGVPTMWKMVADEKGFEASDWNSMRVPFSGGAPVPVSLMNTYQEKGLTFTAGYGLTEGSGFNLYLPQKVSGKKRGGYLPMMWNTVKVVNPDGEPVSAGGEVGEIIIKGPTVFREYWNMPEETKETIRDGWLYTGDLATMDEDGYYFIIDRSKDMIVSGGLNVYPAEVENILQKNPAVSLAAVIGIPDEKWGERVVSVVVPKEGATIASEELIAFCSDKLADYKTPKNVIIVDELPINASGKILKRVLRERYSEGK